MSISEPNGTTKVRTSDRDLTDDRAMDPIVTETTWRETKPSPKTTELWIVVVGVAVLAVIYNASHDVSLNLFRACLLGTVLAAAYVLSRGFAKAGTRDRDESVRLHAPRG
ncbi:MAG: hypothetical protein JWL83_2725 [Actinomycetia bacterium]|nr:hypothetical protein [Actinomycetes bacterium]